MSEVKRHQVVQMFTEDGNKITYSPTGRWVVMASTYDDAQSELAALREELATSNKVGTAIGETLGRVTAERDDLHKRLTAAEQRNAGMTELLRMVQKAARKQGWAFGYPELFNAVDAALKPTESGVSE